MCMWQSQAFGGAWSLGGSVPAEFGMAFCGVFAIALHLLVEPDVDQGGSLEVAGRHGPALDLLVMHDDAVPPQDRHLVRLAQEIAVGRLHQLYARGWIERSVLLIVEFVDLPVSVPRVAHRRCLVADEVVELRCRIVGRFGQRPDRYVEAA